MFDDLTPSVISAPSAAVLHKKSELSEVVVVGIAAAVEFLACFVLSGIHLFIFYFRRKGGGGGRHL